MYNATGAPRPVINKIHSKERKKKERRKDKNLGLLLLLHQKPVFAGLSQPEVWFIRRKYINNISLLGVPIFFFRIGKSISHYLAIYLPR